MTCELPVHECLAWHIKPRLASAQLTEDGLTVRVRARCPSCDSPRTLTISGGEHQRLTWNCFRGDCTHHGIRAALIRAGIPQGCLPRSRAADQAATQAIAAVIQQGTKANRAQTLLRAYLIAQGYDRWPKGPELLKLAGEAGVGRSEAFAARGAGPLLPSRERSRGVNPGTTST